MKNKFKYIIILLLICYNSLSYGQDLKITYGISAENLLSNEQKKRMSSGALEYFATAEKKFKNIEFILNIKDHQALFFRNEKMGNEGNRGVKTAASQSGFPGSYYSNSDNGEIINQWEGYGQKFLICSNNNKLNWEISNKSKIVAGLKTYKATAIEKYNTGKEIKKRKITAWFAPEINHPFGPGGYGGLPGLILEMTRGTKTYTVRKIEEVLLEVSEVEKPTKGKHVSQEEFDAIGEKMVEQMSAF